MYPLRRTLWSSLLCTILLIAACGDDAKTPGASTPATSQPPLETDRYSTVAKCNEFPDSLAGTFQGSALQITPKKKTGDTWSDGAACVALMAKAQQPLSIEVYLFTSGSEGQGFTQAAAYAKAKVSSGETVTGWGDDALWSSGSCQLAVRYSNVVALFQQLSPTPTCRDDIEPIARAYTGLHMK